MRNFISDAELYVDEFRKNFQEIFEATWEAWDACLSVLEHSPKGATLIYCRNKERPIVL